LVAKLLENPESCAGSGRRAAPPNAEMFCTAAWLIFGVIAALLSTRASNLTGCQWSFQPGTRASMRPSCCEGKRARQQIKIEIAHIQVACMRGTLPKGSTTSLRWPRRCRQIL